MTNEERRQFLIDFMRRHSLNDSAMADLLSRNRYWVCRARNNSTGKSNDKGDFTIPPLVVRYMQMFDLLPTGIQKSIIAGDLPPTMPELSLARLRSDEVADYQAVLNATSGALLERFATILDGSSADVLRRATNQLVALEMAKNRANRTLTQQQAADLP